MEPTVDLKTAQERVVRAGDRGYKDAINSALIGLILGRILIECTGRRHDRRAAKKQ